MKLKKAMKKYDIKVDKSSGNPHYCVGTKSIFHSGEAGLWWLNEPTDHNLYPEEQAVSWLIEGATPLSPMERACKKWPIRKEDKKYILGDRGVFKSEVFHLGKWLDDTPQPDEEKWTTYTESEAVAYLLEGYKPELPAVKVILEHVDVERSNDKTTEKSIDINVALNFYPNQAQTVLDTIWRAGYRPTKEVEKP
jgi:hypothetical protein